MSAATAVGAHVVARARVEELRVISELRDGFVMVLNSNVEFLQTRSEVLISVQNLLFRRGKRSWRSERVIFQPGMVHGARVWKHVVAGSAKWVHLELHRHKIETNNLRYHL